MAMAAMMPMIATTISSSTSVKPRVGATRFMICLSGAIPPGNHTDSKRDAEARLMTVSRNSFKQK